MTDCKSSESRATVRSTVDGSGEGGTFAGSLACRQQLIGPPQAIALDIAVTAEIREKSFA
jgi:hypothetical protein